ncbi:MAG TPA: DUF4282 domain-containing protein [Gammaproteobacteria bacterium]
MDFRQVLFFDNMLTPKLITFIYWLFLIGVVIAGVGLMLAQSFLGGLLTLIAGLVFARIWCEMLIVIFKINEALQIIRAK